MARESRKNGRASPWSENALTACEPAPGQRNDRGDGPGGCSGSALANTAIVKSWRREKETRSKCAFGRNSHPSKRQKTVSFFCSDRSGGGSGCII